MPDRPATYRPHRHAQRLGGSSARRDTSAAYQRQRARLLTAEPLCRYCFNRGKITAATVLDHVLALALGGSNHPGNLAPACQPCNAAKGRIEQRLATQGYTGPDAALDPEMGEWMRLALTGVAKGAR